MKASIEIREFSTENKYTYPSNMGPFLYIIIKNKTRSNLHI